MASPGSGARDRNTGGHERGSSNSRSGSSGGQAARAVSTPAPAPGAGWAGAIMGNNAAPAPAPTNGAGWAGTIMGNNAAPAPAPTNKQTYNWTVGPQIPGTEQTEYHDDPYAAEIMNSIYQGLGIMGGGFGIPSAAANMAGITPSLSSMLGLGDPHSPVTGYSSYDHPSNTGQAHGDPNTPEALMQASSGGGGGGAPAAAPGANNWTLDNIYNTLSHGAQGSDLYYLQQRGLAPMDASTIPDEWMPVFQREFDRIKGTVPTSATSGATNGAFGDQASYDAALQQIGALFPGTIGQQALDAEQQRKQNTFKTGIGGLGLENQVSGAFGETADDSILQGIYDQQYQPAAQQLMNALKRGALNPSGYNYGMGQLETQGKAGMGKLQEAGASARATQSGGLNDYIQSIYDKAGGWQLGQQDFDPNAYTSEFNSRFDTAKSNLDSNLQGTNPSIFDVSSALRNAGTVQGTTSRGGLADTIANRNFQKRNQNRGIGSTGAF